MCVMHTRTRSDVSFEYRCMSIYICTPTATTTTHTHNHTHTQDRSDRNKAAALRNCIHLYTDIYKYLYTYMNSRTHTRTRARVHTRMFAQKFVTSKTCVCTESLKKLHSFIHIHLQIHLHMYKTQVFDVIVDPEDPGEVKRQRTLKKLSVQPSIPPFGLKGNQVCVCARACKVTAHPYIRACTNI